MIQRDPIFLKFTDQQMEYKKLRYQMERKYNLIPKLPKEMYEFPSKIPKQEDTSDDMPTHLKTENDVRTYFRENSKWYRFTDPTTSDPKSIQYAGMYTTYLLLKKNNRWFFPTTQVEDKKNFWDTKHRLQREISDNQWHVYITNRLGSLLWQVAEDVPQRGRKEWQNQRNQNLLQISKQMKVWVAF